ncbi:DUF2997 domain-containing protein [Sediminispirochaeta bajacaliforniensis]|uniref:DUF2997 domain-containing protein n=1 Tax=Sediminispirochaeta bajacaliforniensis TaxID=148 RepID=UPI00036ECDDC|nr:DUF2997 domain-containing protein [Sediminispirochaeta bajacaliforniensis]
MAKKEELEITIGENGEVSLHVTGVAGAGCTKLTEELEDALGVVTRRELTGDYYRQEEETSVEIHTDEGKGS